MLPFLNTLLASEVRHSHRLSCCLPDFLLWFQGFQPGEPLVLHGDSPGVLQQNSEFHQIPTLVFKHRCFLKTVWLLLASSTFSASQACTLSTKLSFTFHSILYVFLFSLWALATLGLCKHVEVGYFNTKDSNVIEWGLVLGPDVFGGSLGKHLHVFCWKLFKNLFLNCVALQELNLKWKGKRILSVLLPLCILHKFH